MTPVVSVIGGSYLYGTHKHPTSDVDVRSVHMSSLQKKLFGNYHTDPSYTMEDIEILKTSAYRCIKNVYGLDVTIEKNDFTSTDLVDFLMMVNQSEITALDIAFAPEQYILHQTDIWKMIKKEVIPFIISKDIAKALSFSRRVSDNYIIRYDRYQSQQKVLDFLWELVLKGYGNNKCSEFEEDFIKLSEEDELIEFLRKDVNMLKVCFKKLQMTSRVTHNYNIMKDAVASYSKRVVDNESASGKDWKAIMHAIRVGEQTIELLETGFITFPRPNTEYLLKVRNGECLMEEVLSYLDDLELKVQEAETKSSLPVKGDVNLIKDAITSFYRYVC